MIGISSRTVLTRTGSSVIRFCRTKATKRVLNKNNEESLPVYQYASAKSDKRNRVFTWGLAEHGALGERQFLKPIHKARRPVEYMHRPYRLGFAEENDVTDIAAGYGFTVFITKGKKTTSSQVFGTGLNTDSQIGYHAVRKDHPLELVVEPVPIHLPNIKSSITGIACGRAHTLVLTEKAGVLTLGNNAYGQCGRHIIEDEDYQRQSTVHQIVINDKISQVYCGQDHSMFVTDQGSVWSCGWSADGQTGVGHYNNTDRITKCVGDIVGENIIKLACSADCVLALNDKGQVFGWGNSEYGQLRLATSEMQLHTPRYLPLPQIFGKIVDVAASGTACLILNDAGEVFVWGYGILGKGPVVDKSQEPTAIPLTLFGCNEFNPDGKVVSIYGGLSQFAAVTNNGDLYIWGRNRFGSLGLGHLDNQFFPIKVNIPGYVKKFCFGVDHCVALCKSYV